MAQSQHQIPSPNMSNEISNIISRIRMIEERHANMQRKLHLMEENMLSSSKDMKTEMKILQQDVLDIKRKVKNFEDTLTKISQGLEDLATRQEVKLIERYVNLLDPTNFISRKHLENEVRRQVTEQLQNAGKNQNQQ